MIRTCLLAAAAAALMAVGAPAAPLPGYVNAAIADSARPVDDTKRDEDRKPGQMLVFAGIKPGSKVMDLIPGGGYFTRIFAKVVGPTGWVYAFSPAEIDPLIAKRFPGVDIKKQFAAYNNVSVLHADIVKIGRAHV